MPLGAKAVDGVTMSLVKVLASKVLARGAARASEPSAGTGHAAKPHRRILCVLAVTATFLSMTSQIHAADGSAAAPPVSFIADGTAETALCLSHPGSPTVTEQPCSDPFGTEAFQERRLPPEEANARAVYPFGQSSGPLFEKAIWTFGEPDIFAFWPDINAVESIEYFAITGTYESKAGAYELHGETELGPRARASLDGWIFPQGSGHRLEAMLVVTYASFVQVERVRQTFGSTLTPNEIGHRLRQRQEAFYRQEVRRQRWTAIGGSAGGPPGSDAVSGLDELTLEELIEQYLAGIATGDGDRYAHRLDTIPSEAETPPGSAPMPPEEGEPADDIVAGLASTHYRVQLTGTVDGESFGPLDGFLLTGELGPDDGLRQPVTLATSDFDKIGAVYWTNERSRSPAHPASAEDAHAASRLLGTIQRRDGTVTIDLELPQGRSLVAEGQSVWRTTEGASDDWQPPMVTLAEGRLTYSVDGDAVHGSLRATGFRSPQLRVGSSYHAEFRGALARSERVETLRRITGERSLDGTWIEQGSPGERIRLVQDETRIERSFREDEADQKPMSGVVVDGVAKLIEHTPTGPSRAMVLRSVPGGGWLVGYAYPSDRPTEAEPMVLWQAATVSRRAASAPSAVEAREPTSEDMLEARHLAWDLMLAGKCRQALNLLEPLFDDYLALSNTSLADTTVSFFKKKEYLIQSSAAVSPLAVCSLQIGDYERLLRYVGIGIRLVRDLAPGADLLRLHDDRRGLFAENAAGTWDTLSILRDQVGRLHSLLGSGIIGIALADQEGALVISTVAQGSPADAAGLRAGDVLVAVNGASAAGMSIDSATTGLRGPAGESITLAVRRQDRRVDIEIVRAPFGPASPERQAAFEQGLEQEIASLERVRTALSQPFVPADASTKTAALEALQALQADVHERAQVLAQASRDTVERARTLYDPYPDLLMHFNAVIEALARVTAGVPDGAVDGQPMREAEAHETAVLEPVNDDLSEVERLLIGRQLYIASTLFSASRQLGFEADRLTDFADLAAADENDVRATEEIRELAHRLDQWRDRLVTDQAKIAALQLSQGFYDTAVDLYVDLGAAEEALVMAEASRARAFADLLESRLGAGATAMGHVAGPSILSMAQAPPPDLQALRSTVEAIGAPVLEFHGLEDRLLIWLIHPTGGIELTEIGTGAERLKAGVQRFIETVALADPDQPPDPAVQDAAGSALYDQLIAPVAERLEPYRGQTLLIVPHRELFRVSFAALRSPSGRHLIDDHAVVYASSLAIAGYAERRRGRERSGLPRLLALVDPEPMEDLSGRPMAPLDYTERKIGALAAHYGMDGAIGCGEGTGPAHAHGSTILCGREANLASLTTHGRRHDVVYLATHGVASDDEPLDQTFVALAGAPLTLSQVYRNPLRLDAELVILGACETARGPVTGDGVNDLGRAFTSAGGASLMTTLWKPAQTVMVDLLDHFHRFWLEHGMTKAQALRHAQLTIRGSNPYQIDVWSPVVLFGVE